MRMRLALSFVLLLAFFGWILARAITHSALLQTHFDEESQRHHIRVVLWLFMGVLFPAMAIGAWMLVARTLRPLRALSKQASEATAESRLVAPSSDSEMVELVATLNELLQRIEITSAAKASFYAAASHELRTPLQALAGHLETALSKERTAEDYRQALAEAQSQSSRLSELTRDILLLHQLQAQGVGPEERADLSASLEVVLRELGPLIEARGLRIFWEPAQPFIVKGRQSYADIAIRNLVENAARYTTAGGAIQIQQTASGLIITNECEIPGGSDSERLFEPFERSATGGGNGLGLAVCRAAAKANGWTLTARFESGMFIVNLTS